MLPNIKLTHFTLKHLHTNKGVSLIIVIFAMMLFAVLGWTLAVMQSTDFEANLRNLDSERALGLAEAGAQWALRQLMLITSWRTTGMLHSLSPGQYNVVVQDGAVSGQVEIISTGYIPAQANYRSMRQVKLVVELGSFNKALQTKVSGPGNQGLFNWWPAKQSHTVLIGGNISAGDYDGDGDASYNEIGPCNGIGPNEDYNESPLCPPGNVGDKRDRNVNFPSISMYMQDFYNQATDSTRFPPPARTIPIAETALSTSESNYIEVATNGFFTGMTNEAVRNMGVGHGTWADTDWAVINSVPGEYNGRRAVLDTTIGDTSWDNDEIRLVKHIFRSSPHTPDGIWYVGREVLGPGPLNIPADILIDIRTEKPGPDDDVELRDTYLICEGDIVIKGTNQLIIRFIATGPRHPTLATRNGNIISREPVTDASQRQIAGLVYSEFGHVDLNYLSYPIIGSLSYRGNLVYGSRVTLDGDISILHRPAVIPSGGFNFSPSVLSWQEQ